MTRKATIKKKERILAQSYQTALLRYLKQSRGGSLRPALKLGREATAMGLETLDMALIHERALVAAIDVLPEHTPAVAKRILKLAGVFFAEAIMPMKATHQMVLEANDHLNELNQALKLRTRDLTASNRKLEKEITKRRTAQELLLKNEEHSERLLEKSQLLQKQLRLLSHKVLSVQEDERKRISRELHDVIAQMLTGINTRLATLKIEATSNNKSLSRKISHTQRLVEKSVDIVHRFALQLRPAVLDDLGLVPAVHAYLKVFMKETGIRVNFTASPNVDIKNSAKRTTLYRVAQEALTNIVRHAHAERVDLIIRTVPNAVLLQIKDKSKGFDVEQMWRENKSRHLGVIGMQERVEMAGGTFKIESVPDQGTTVEARIPLSNGIKKEHRA